MVFTDFIIKYDPKIDTHETLAKKILYTITVKRLKYNKPSVIGIFGDSGEGKTMTITKILMILCEMQNYDFKKYIEVMNVFAPIQYPKNMDKILYDKEYKKVNCIAIQDARIAVKAKLWYDFLTQAISDINALVRAKKRMVVFIATQFIRDIALDIRYTLNYYFEVHRPMGGSRKVRLKLYAMWRDSRDIERPRLRKRRISGYLLYPNGRRRRFTPKFIEITQPETEIRNIVNKLDYEAKGEIIKRKLMKCIDKINDEWGIKDDKIKKIIDFYADNITQFATTGKVRSGKWITDKKLKDMFDLNDKQFVRLNEELNKIFLEVNNNEREPIQRESEI